MATYMIVDLLILCYTKMPYCHILAVRHFNNYETSYSIDPPDVLACSLYAFNCS